MPNESPIVLRHAMKLWSACEPSFEGLLETRSSHEILDMLSDDRNGASISLGSSRASALASSEVSVVWTGDDAA
jgi:hypothetical protein